GRDVADAEPALRVSGRGRGKGCDTGLCRGPASMSGMQCLDTETRVVEQEGQGGAVRGAVAGRQAQYFLEASACLCHSALRLERQAEVVARRREGRTQPDRLLIAADRCVEIVPGGVNVAQCIVDLSRVRREPQRVLAGSEGLVVLSPGEQCVGEVEVCSGVGRL